MSKNQSRNSKLGFGCLFIFALPFAAVGLGMLAAICSAFFQSAMMQSWPKENAFVQSVSLETHHNDETTTFQVHATYVYTYQGKQYRSDRISLHQGADNIGKFHKRVAAKLKKHQRQGEPVRCFVNPNDPAEAILYRAPRFEMIAFHNAFVLLFGGFGFGLIVAAIAARPGIKRERELQEEFPNEPWKWKQAWLDRSIPCGRKLTDRTVTYLAVWCNVITLPTVCMIPFELLNGNNWSLLGLIYCGVGGLVACISFKRWRANRKFGTPIFQMAAETGVAGGCLAGVIRIPSQIDLAEGCQQRIFCERRVRSGKNSRTIVMWEEQRIIAREMLERDPSQSAIPVLFAIPHGASESGPGNTWKLELSATTGSEKLKTWFEIPVFETSASSPDFKLDESTIEPFAFSTDPAQQIRMDSSLRISQDRFGRTKIVAPMFRTPSIAIPLLLVAMVFSVVPLAFSDEIESGFASGFLGLLALLLWVGFVNTAFYKSCLTDNGNHLVFRGGLFGKGRDRRLDKSAITAVRLSTSMKAGVTMYYNIKIECDGDLTNVVSQVEGKLLAEAVKSEIERMVLDDESGTSNHKPVTALHQEEPKRSDLEPVAV